MPKCNFNKVALQSNFIEIILRHGCSHVNLLHIFRTSFPKNTSGRVLMSLCLFVIGRNVSFFVDYRINPKKAGISI